MPSSPQPSGRVPPGLAAPGSVLAALRARVAAGALDPDPAQEAAARKLDALKAAIEAGGLARKESALGWLFGAKPAEPLRGLYVWGAVGRGKTMLMDLFFEAVAAKSKRRAHFHAFMGDVHARIAAHRARVKRGEAKDADPIAAVAEALAEQARLLCFDEFAVVDIADAMILGRLFTALFAHGVVVVATSNVVPDRLYEGGLNRALFLPFVALLQERMDVLELRARADYRLEKLGAASVWHVPADEGARAALDAAFARLAGGARVRPVLLEVAGRALPVERAAGGVARFAFPELCDRPLGAGDYLALARSFHTIVLDAIPAMDASRRNEAKRFITLIDVLYEGRVKLVASADAEPDDLYRADPASPVGGREAFEWARCASRLIEMRSRDYLALPHGRRDPVAGGSSAGLAET